MTPSGLALRLGCVLAWLTAGGVDSVADQSFEPGDPIAAIDGQAVYLGELNLVLSQRLGARDLDKLPIEVQQATAALLVRRHLALKSLEDQGGQRLEAMIRREVQSQADEARRRGSSLEQQARASKADEKSLVADIAWRTAWSQYLKSRLTDTNLRRFFERHRDRYGGGRWEVSQIFVKVDTTDAESVKAAQANLIELAKELRSSGSRADAFAEAAQQFSDSGSAAGGGMIGWVEKDGDLPHQVMEAVRNTQVAAISDPVRSARGLHLVYVHRREPGELEFDDVVDQSQLRRDAADALFDALLAQQKDAKVVWFVKALQPPRDVRLVPQ